MLLCQPPQRGCASSRLDQELEISANAARLRQEPAYPRTNCWILRISGIAPEFSANMWDSLLA